MHKILKQAKRLIYVVWIGLGFIFGIFLTTFMLESSASTKQNLPMTQILIRGNDYDLAYDKRTKNPSWILEIVDNAHPSQIDYSSLSLIPETFLPQKEDYEHSHFEPILLLINLDSNSSLVATSPLNPELAKGYWMRLNAYLQELPNQLNIKKLLVITEPLFLPEKKSNQKIVNYELIGKNNVAVPTHILRAVFYLADAPSEAQEMHDEFTIAAPLLETEHFHSKLKGKIYLIPNKPIAETTDLETFRMTNWDEIQQLPGVVFPPHMARYLEH